VKKPRYVLDSCALLAYLRAEPGDDEVKSLLEEAQKGQAEVYFSLINLGEVAYIVERRKGAAVADEAIEKVYSLPIFIADVDKKRILDAAHIKANHAISYADAFAVALAKELDAPVVTGDPEFKKVEPMVQVFWLCGT
jgi:predicted nucleic acid-binding protein